MSGIVGQINKSDNLKEMLKLLRHRGKFISTYNDEFISLAKCTLKKEDIYENGNYIIIYDGNIECKNKVPEEYLLNLYKKYKEDAFSKIKGSFSICIYNKKEECIILARDKFGRKPLYYTKDNFIFASEVKCILENLDYELNENILIDYFTYLHNPYEETIFKGIYKVPSGSYIIYKNNSIEVKKYYEFEFKNLIYDEEELKDKIKNNLEKNFKHNKETASFLSSGIDSSLIVTLSKPKDTYTIGYDESSYSETYHTGSLCNYLNINNNVKIVNYKEFLKRIKEVQYQMDEPCLDPAAVALSFAPKMVKENYKYIYSGEGSDELFAGYNTYLDMVKYRKYTMYPKCFKKLICNICRMLPEIKGVNFLLRRFSDTKEYYVGVSKIFNERTLKKLVNSKKKIDVRKNNYFIKDDYDDIESLQIVDINYWLSAEINATERLCAYDGIEVITPFLNDELVQIASSVPSSYKVCNGVSKSILREVAKDILPSDFSQIKKLGFPVPIKTWLKTPEYYNEFLNVFNSENALKLFNHKMLLKMLNDTYESRKDWSKQVYAIYSFLVWYECFFTK
ncbi:MAG: hypothetical protein IJO63_04230 [Bacilli bacterium]|nr:hypothetical protein [Bacilli bacterium]